MTPFTVARTRFALAVVVLALLGTAAACGGESGARPTTSPPAAISTATAPATAGPNGSPTPATAAASTAATARAPLPTAAPGRLGTSSGVATTIRPPDFVALPGAKAYFGVLGKAAYRVEMPDNWNGDLVLHLHGVRLGGNEVYVSSPDDALRQSWIAGGYAWAASSYSENGYAPGVGADDSMDLLQRFTTQFGAPRRVYLDGVSMGGHVTALLLEHYPDRFAGALAVCGALGGEEELDYIMAWAMAAEYASGVRIPVGDTTGLGAVLVTQLPAALGRVDAPTSRGKLFIDLVRNLTGGPRPFFLEGLQESYLNNFGLLVLDPGRLTLAARAATNAHLRYRLDRSFGVTDEALNAAVRRLAADETARDAAAHPDAVPTTGKIARPLLTLHGTGDLFVPITNEVSYRQKAEAVGSGGLLVQRAIRAPGHCTFSDAELTTAWNDLVAWVKDGKKPAGDDLLGDLTDVGRTFTNPLRVGDPGTR
ncbi:MAG: phthalyl amidase [Dehalococcoidia bacterium]|nr:phthalyl amidase [Dehalococcoidia bacterium]